MTHVWLAEHDSLQRPPRIALNSPLKKSFGRRNWPLHAQLDRVNTRKSRRLPPFAAADLDAKRPVFGSKHFFNRLLRIANVNDLLDVMARMVDIVSGQVGE